MIVLNNTILNLSFNNCRYINIMIMNTFVKLFFENNSLLIVNFQNSKLWTNWLIGLFIKIVELILFSTPNCL
jgi:hypothetical protein